MHISDINIWFKYLRLLFIDNINCFVSKDKLIIKTKDGSDFWTNDDWVADWNLFFNDKNGIYLDTWPLTGVETPLQIDSIKIEDILVKAMQEAQIDVLKFT